MTRRPPGETAKKNRAYFLRFSEGQWARLSFRTGPGCPLRSRIQAYRGALARKGDG